MCGEPEERTSVSIAVEGTRDPWRRRHCFCSKGLVHPVYDRWPLSPHLSHLRGPSGQWSLTSAAESQWFLLPCASLAESEGCRTETGRRQVSPQIPYWFTQECEGIGLFLKHFLYVSIKQVIAYLNSQHSLVDRP